MRWPLTQHCTVVTFLPLSRELAYLDVPDDNNLPVAVEDILPMGVSVDDQRHTTLGVGQGGKHTLCENGCTCNIALGLYTHSCMTTSVLAHTEEEAMYYAGGCAAKTAPPTHTQT